MFKINELLKATNGSLVNPASVPHIKGISIDSRAIKPQYAFIAIKGKNFDGHDFITEAIKKGASCIIVHSLQCPAVHNKNRVAVIKVNDTTRALGDIARFQRTKFNIPVIAVTGSNGKTTTKEMIAWVLSKKFKVLKNEGTKNNQIGLALALLDLNGSHDIAVLEIGTNHFGEINYLTNICRPNIGIITNIGAAHLEYLQSLEGVFKEKYEMIKNLKNPRIGILNGDDGLLNKRILIKAKTPVSFSFSIKNPADFRASNIKYASQKIGFYINQKYKFTLKTLGYYNIYNASASIAAARIFGMEYKDISSRLSTFVFPQSRLKLIKFNNIKFIDDTYNSNPVSLGEALNALANCATEGRKIFVMGDMLELGSSKKTFHYRIGKEVARCCDIFITVGSLSRLTAVAAKNSGFNGNDVFNCKTADQARDILFNRISPDKDDIVLVKGSRSMKMEEVFRK